MATTAEWKGTPRIISYDVIGSYLYGNLTRLSTPITYLYWSGNTIEFTDRVYSGNGYGCTALLQNSSVNMIVAQDVDIRVDGSGTFYSSYQHATKRITLETSKKYTTGFGGYVAYSSFTDLLLEFMIKWLALTFIYPNSFLYNNVNGY